MVKKKKEKIEIVEMTSKGYIITCPICKEKLNPAKSESQARWNLEIHIKAKHPCGRKKNETRP